MRAKVILATGLSIVLAACGDRQLSSLEKLAERGYSLSIQEYFRAASGGDVDALDLFLKSGTAVDVPDDRGESALALATRAGKADAVRFLIERGAKTGMQDDLLSLAIASGKAEVVEVCLKAGVNTGSKDAAGLMPLEQAAKIGNAGITELLLPLLRDQTHSALICAAGSGDTATLDLLIQAEANPFARDQEGATALHRAAEAGHAEAVQLLLADGASRFTLDQKGRTPLEIAAARSHERVTSLLKADPTADERSLDAARFSKPASAADDNQPLKEVPAAIPLTEDAASIHLLQRLPALDGAIVDHRVSVTGFPAKPEDRLTVRLIRPQQLPFVLEGCGGGEARFRLMDDKDGIISVQSGQTLPGTAWVLESIRPTPLAAGPLPGSWFPNVILRDASSGNRHLAIAHLPLRDGALTAVLEVPDTDEVFEARTGDRFHFSGDEDHEVRVVEITPRRAVLKRSDHTWTIRP